jgi:peroxiredoxin
VLADDDPARLREMRRRLGLDIPFLHDPGGEVGNAYGVLYTPAERGGHLEPAILVLTPDARLFTGAYATGSVGRMSVDEALRAVRRLRGEE